MIFTRKHEDFMGKLLVSGRVFQTFPSPTPKKGCALTFPPRNRLMVPQTLAKSRFGRVWKRRKRQKKRKIFREHLSLYHQKNCQGKAYEIVVVFCQNLSANHLESLPSLPIPQSSSNWPPPSRLPT